MNGNRCSRIRRAATYAVCGASLLVLIASLALWAWFGRYEVSVVCVRPTWQLTVGAFPNAIIIDRTIVTWPLHPGWEVNRGNFGITTDFDVGDETGRQVSLYRGFPGGAVRTIRRTYASESGQAPYVARELDVWLPYWLLVVISAPLPLWLAARQRVAFVRARRRARGQCATCGYDLRATPGRCPECGTIARASLWAKLRAYAARRLPQQKVALAGESITPVA